MYRYALAFTVALLLCTPAFASAPTKPSPFSTKPLSSMALSKPGGPVGDIAFAHKGDIYTVTLDGRHIRRLTNDGRNAFPIWSRDGKRIAFTKASKVSNDWFSAEVWAITADGKYCHAVTKPESFIAKTPVAWLPRDRALLVVNCYLESDVTETIDVATLDGKPYPALRDWMRASRRAKFIQHFAEGPEEFAAGQAADVSADGSRVIFTAGTKLWVDMPQPDLYVMNVDGTSLRQLQEMPHTYIFCLKWGDRKGRVLSMETDLDRNDDRASIWLRDANGKQLSKLADLADPAANGMDWSPDGRYVVYGLTDGLYGMYEYPGTYAQMSDHCSLWIMNADGSGKYKLADNACTPNWRKH